MPVAHVPRGGRRGRRTASVLRSAVAVCLLASAPAWSATTAPDLDATLHDLEGDVTVLVDRARVLEQRVAAGEHGGATANSVQRYEEAVYRFLIKDYEPAAETFFVLVSTDALSNAGLARDAEFYLGESLFQLGYLQLAEGTFRAIMDQPSHPFREDAVRRLLEIYAQDPTPYRFDRLFNEAILQGGVPPSDRIAYAVGKAFRMRGDPAKAKSWFGNIEPDSPYYVRAQYTIGAMLVAAGGEAALRDALGVFTPLADRATKDDDGVLTVTADDAYVIDLARLALGRIHDHLGEGAAAVEAYGKVGEDSRLLADKLHELAWVFIKQGDWSSASRAVDVFLVAFPEHAYAAELRLVQGHLRFEQGELDNAVATYQALIDDFDPVVAQFRDMASGAHDARTFFRELVAVDEVEAVSPDADAAALADDTLPPFAVSTLLDDPTFRGTVDLYQELEAQDKAITASEGMVEELDGPLGGGDAEASIEVVGLQVRDVQAQLLAERLDLLATESRYVRERAGGVVGSDLDRLDQQRTALLRRVETVVRVIADARNAVAATAPVAPAPVADAATDEPATTGPDGMPVAPPVAPPPRPTVDTAAVRQRTRGELAGLLTEVDALAASYHAVRGAPGVDLDLDPTVARLDVMAEAIGRADVRLAHVDDDLGNLTGDGFRRIRDTYRTEAAAVAAERTEIDARFSRTESLALALIRNNFERVADVFADRVMGADMGIVNVSWSQWVQAGESRDQLQNERDQVLSALRDKYDLVEQKMKQ